MAITIQTFSDGSKIYYDKGRFDDWCVYLERPNKSKIAPRDTDYFAQFQTLGTKHGYDTIYEDFVEIYNNTSSVLNKTTLDLILELTNKYKEDSLEMAIGFTIIYAAMIAEEKKAFTKLGKRIKRLGFHQTMVDKISPTDAAKFSYGKPWRDLDAICKSKGF